MKRTAASSVEARIGAGDAAGNAAGQEGQRCVPQSRQIGQEVVDGLELLLIDIGEDCRHARLGLAREKRHPEVEGLLQFVRYPGKHRQRAADVKTADHDRHALRPEGPPQIERPGELIGLHADQSDKARIRSPYGSCQLSGVDAPVAFIVGFDLNSRVRSEHLPVGAIPDQPVNAGKAVRRDQTPSPLDDVSVVIVVRGLDQNDLEKPCHV